MSEPWKRKEVIGDCTLYLGDCLQILPHLTLPSSMVTDIPYELAQDTNGLRSLDYGSWDREGADSVAFKAMDLCKDIPSVTVWSEWKQTSRLSDLFDRKSNRLLAWVKSNPTVMNGQHLFLPGLETAYYGKKPGAWFGGNCVSSVWRGAAPQERQHPTEKPLDLMRWYVINTVAPDSACLDPFMGGGTTGAACSMLGRGFVGIEIEEKFFDIACERIAKAERQPDMLIYATKPPEQVGMEF